MQNLNYIFDEGTRTFLQMDDNWSYEDFDIFVTDSTKESQAIEQLKSLVQPAMQNGASLLDAAEIFTSDNLSVIKSKLRDIENNRLEQQQAMQEQEKTQKEVADFLGISQSYISRIEKKILGKMKKELDKMAN